MVQRWQFADWSHAGDGASMDPEPEGKWVRIEDYLSLQAALREALELVERWVPDESGTMERLKELQKQFLDI